MSRTDQQPGRPWAFDPGLATREAALLVLLAIVAAAAAWGLRSDRLPLSADLATYELEITAPVLDIAEALTLFDEGDCLFIDTRSDRSDGSITILGAFPIRAASFDDDLYELADTVYPEDPLVLFGDGNLAGTAHVADLLLARGYADVRILRGSVEAWQDAGGEISAFTAPTAAETEAGT